MFTRTLALLGLLVALPSTALAADDVGAVGYVTELQVNQTSAETYLQFHGRAFLGGGAKQAAVEYRWGGTSCGTRVLSEHQVSLLMRAFESGLRVLHDVGDVGLRLAELVYDALEQSGATADLRDEVAELPLAWSA